MVFFLVKRNIVPRVSDLPDFNVVEMGELISEDYYSVTFKGKKIGYNSVIKRKLPSGLLYQETSYYNLTIGGISQEITTEGLITVDDSLRAKVLTFHFSGGGYETNINAIVREDQLLVEINTPSGSRNIKLPFDGEIYTSSVIPELIKRRGFESGRFELPSFDPITANSRSYKVDVIGRDRLRRFGDRDVWEVRLFYGPLTTGLWIDSTGVLLMEKTAEGFMSVRENKEKALKFDLRQSADIDFLSEFAVSLGGSVIERPRDAVRLVIKIKNLQTELFNLNDFNQRWDPDSQTLVIDSRGFDDSLSFVVLSEDTLASLDIQCNDRRIISAAEKITRDSKTDFDKVKAINTYLFKKIDKNLTASIPNAVEVLQKMRGDCNEHTILFVALARAIGIPARMNVGLLYLDGYFYYHAWPQAYIDSAWHTFDPTLGQSPTDAAHIKLTSGNLDQMLALLRFGDARLSFIDVEYEGEEIEQR